MNQGKAIRDWQPIPTLLLGLLVLAAAALSALWWWTGTEASLQWAIGRAQRMQPITIEEAHGSLRSGATLARVAWQRDGLQVEAEKVAVEWRPLLLLGGTFKFDRVHAALVRVTDRRPPSNEPLAPLTDLSLPVQVALDELSVERIEWITSRTVVGENLAGRYWFDGKAHSLRVDRFTWAGAAYRGEASLGATLPMPVSATLAGEAAAPIPGAGTVPVQFTATLKGPLANMEASAQIVAAPDGSPVTQAAATARITPWAELPVPQAQAAFDRLDLASVWKEAPQTTLSGSVSIVPSGTASWQASADVRNSGAGPWDAGKLPVEAVKAQGEWRSGMALVKSLTARLGGGTLQASGTWQQAGGDAKASAGAKVSAHATAPADAKSRSETRPSADAKSDTGAKAGWSLRGKVDGVNPAALHTRLDAMPLSGSLSARQDGAAITFDANLRGNARATAKKATRAKGPPPIMLTLLKARGRWADGLLSVADFEARTADASLTGAVDYRFRDVSVSGRALLQAPGLQADSSGTLSQTRGAGKLDLRASDLAQARAWIARLPAAPSAANWPDLSGRANLALAWQGGWRDPAVDATLTSPRIELRAKSTTASATSAWVVSDLTASTKGRLSNAAINLRANARQGDRSATLAVAGTGGMRFAGRQADWHAAIASLSAQFRDKPSTQGAWRIDLQGLLEVRGRGADFEAGAGSALLGAPAAPSAARAAKAPAVAKLAWQPVRRRAGELTTAGRLEGLPMSWLELFSPQLAGSALSGDMVFDAQWDAALGSVLRLDASLARRSGDVSVLADSGDGVAQRVAAGVREARLTLTGRGDELTAVLKWDSERAGTADGRLVTRLVPGGALGRQWPQDAPVDASFKAQLPKLGVWSLLAPPGWRLRGSLLADIRVDGTRAQPRLSGSIAADDLALRSVVDGIELGDGRLRATLEGTRIRITEFMLRGAGERGAGGTLNASGDVAWVDGAPRLNATAQLTRLRASIRTDRELTVSGTLEAVVDSAGTAINGRLKVDQASIVLPEEAAPRLGDDVVVRGSPEFAGTVKDRKAETAQERDSAKPLSVTVDLDLGDNFRVSGRGLRTRVAGMLALSARSMSEPRLSGTLRTVGGEYRAFGQRLDIERGIVRFSGAAGNPGLDVLAIRPNIAQRVGVLVTGTAQAPFVRLYAEPDLPDAEKLAWLVTGRPAPEGGAESALVQQAALALLTGRKPGSQTFASRAGLDELSLRRDSSAGAVVTVGKRFAENFYASYERSLSGALGTLFVFFDISKKLTLRAQAGERTGVDLIYTFRFD